MGEVTLWDRIWPWFRHPLSTLAVTIAFRYCESHGLEIHPSTAECTCNVDNGYRCDRHPRKAMRRRQMTQDGLTWLR